MNWSEEASLKMDEIAATLPSKLLAPQRCKAVKEACPYNDPIKVKAWKALAQSRFNPGKVKKPITRLQGDEQQQQWIARNLR